jgi:thiol-disulfide isomerase/thioredoxin
LPSTIEQVHKEFGPRGLSILLINIQESRDTAARWVKEKGITPRVLLDPDGSATVAYRVTGTPTVVLIGRDGRMVGRAVGTRGWTSPAGRALLNALLQPAGR